MKGVIISDPEVTEFNIGPNVDAFVLGCDGIFDMLSNEEVQQCMEIARNESDLDVHKQTGVAVDLIMKTCLFRKSLDNITCVIVAFKGFEGRNGIEYVQTEVEESRVRKVGFRKSLDSGANTKTKLKLTSLAAHRKNDSDNFFKSDLTLKSKLISSINKGIARKLKVVGERQKRVVTENNDSDQKNLSRRISVKLKGLLK